jgi:V/A-type H+-transporting ATPase subunit F
MKVAALCDKETAVGLQLTGVRDCYVPDSKTALTLFSELTKRTDVGVVIITEKIARDLEAALKDFRLHKKSPIFVEIPDKTGKLKDHVDIVSVLIKRAVGIDVSKKEEQR